MNIYDYVIYIITGLKNLTSFTIGQVLAPSVFAHLKKYVLHVLVPSLLASASDEDEMKVALHELKAETFSLPIDQHIAPMILERFVSGG